MENRMSNTNPYTSRQQLLCAFITRDFVPDGDLSKPVWNEVAPITFDRDVYTGISYPGSETKVAALWTRHNIYFSFSCKYTSLNIYEGEDVAEERWELWNRDVVEVFINPEPHRIFHYYEFEVAPNNQWIDLEIDKTKNPFYDPVWNSGFAHATHVKREAGEWTCEMRIPQAPMGVREILDGDDWRVNFFRADGLGDESPRHLISWCTIPGGETFHTPERFGLLRFQK